MSEPRQWDMWAHHYPGSPTPFQHINRHPRVTALYSDEEIVEVRLIEDPEGAYMGWVETGEEGIDLVEHYRIFEIQFPYGHKAEEEAGKGRAVRVRAARKSTAWEQRWQAERKDELEQLLDIQNSGEDDQGCRLTPAALAELAADIATLRTAIEEAEET